MGCRVGITTRPTERKNEWLLKYPNMRNWQLFGPFINREVAQAWEDRQIPCDRSGGGADPDLILAQWYGFKFEF